MRLHTAALAVLVGCTGGDDTGKATGSAGSAVSGDWALPDVNPNSATYNTDVTVGDFEGRVSAWYFAHST